MVFGCFNLEDSVLTSSTLSHSHTSLKGHTFTNFAHDILCKILHILIRLANIRFHKVVRMCKILVRSHGLFPAISLHISQVQVKGLMLIFY